MDMKVVASIKRIAGVPAVGYRGMFRLGDLVSTPNNVRKSKRMEDVIYRMAVSIYHQGVMQNLLLEPVFKDGQWTGQMGVVAGETRRLALRLLRDGGVPGAEGYTDDYEVPGLVIAEADAVALSGSENIIRTPLHPADEFEVFKELFDQCGSVEHVAAFFAVDERFVHQRLRMANASPKLFDLFRSGGMEIDQLMALCLTDDHDRQEKAWKHGAQNDYYRRPDMLRRTLTEGKVALRDRVARFVGADAYEAAGGVVERDLFSEHEGDGYLADQGLLQRLALEKLEATAANVRAEGWPWIEVRETFEYTEQCRYNRVVVRQRKMTDAEAAEIARLDKVLAKTQRAVETMRKAGNFDSEACKALRQECAANRAATASIEAARTSVDAVAKPFAGAVVSIDQRGEVQVHRGFVKPEDCKAYAKAEKTKERERAQKKAAAVGIEGEGADAVLGQSEGLGDLSRALTLRLGAQRTAALQVTVAHNVPLALATLAYALVDRVFREGDLEQGVMRIVATLVQDRLTSLDHDMPESKAFKEMDALLQVWAERLPETDLFGWLLALEQSELLQLIAVCSAATINTVGDDSQEARALEGMPAQVAEAGALSMADWWEATGGSYLGSVSKAHVLAALAEAGIAAAEVEPLAKLKKGELVDRAETLLAGRCWVPSVLRTAKA